MIFVKTLTSPTRPRAKPMIRVLFARKICFYRSLFSFLKVAPDQYCNKINYLLPKARIFL